MSKSIIKGLWFLTAACVLPVSASAELLYFHAPHGESKIVDTADLTPMGKVGSKGVFQNTNKATGITFNVEFLDVTNTTGVGFDEAAGGAGATRRATVLAVFDYLNTVLDYPSGTLDVQVQNSETDGTGFLAAAGTQYFVTDGFQDGLTLQRLNTGTKPAGVPEISITVDFGYTWNDGVDPVQSGEFDLFSTMLHEVTHGLGFGSLLDTDGTSALTGAEVFSRFDELFALPGTPGTPAISGVPPMFQGSTAPITGGANSIIFTGSDAGTDFGSAPFIATPTPHAPGSSLSHWQGSVGSFFVADTQQGGLTAVMVPSTPTNEERRAYRPFEIEALSDMGFAIQSASSTTDWNLY